LTTPFTELIINLSKNDDVKAEAKLDLTDLNGFAGIFYG